jgi:hypothetical protein
VISLSLDQIKKIPALYKLYEQEGAISVLDASTRQGSTDEWVLIKVPTIDGTELWLVEASEQESVEKKIGFQKKSNPLLTLSKEQLKCIHS